VRVRRPELATALDAYDLRVELEGMAARLAAQRADVDGRAALTLLLEQVEASEADDVAAQVEADMVFHRTVAKLSASEPLQLALETLAGYLTPLKVLTRDQNASAPTRIQHRTIATAIQGGDGSEAERAMRVHVLHFRSIVASRYTSESQVMP